MLAPQRTSAGSSNQTSEPLNVCSAGRGLSGVMLSTGRSSSSSCEANPPITSVATIQNVTQK
jgi:hypothetical protein